MCHIIDVYFTGYLFLLVRYRSLCAMRQIYYSECDTSLDPTIVFGSSHHYHTRLSSSQTQLYVQNSVDCQPIRKHFGTSLHTGGMTCLKRLSHLLPSPIYMAIFCVIMISVFCVCASLYQLLFCILCVYVCRIVIVCTYVCWCTPAWKNGIQLNAAIKTQSNKCRGFGRFQNFLVISDLN